MASPPPPPPPPAAAAAASPPAKATSTHPPPRAFLSSSSPRRAAGPTPSPPAPLFTGRPLNPNPNPSPNPRDILYAVSSNHHRRPPSSGAGPPRAHVVPSSPPPAQPRSFPAAAPPRPAAAARPEQPLRGVPVASQPKANSSQSIAPSHEHSNAKEREKSREDTTTVVINDRKVRLLDSESGSLYALCRSWVRNGLPHESQPTFGNGEPLLPRPLPASVVDSRISEKDETANGDEDSEEYEDGKHDYSASSLLAEHVKRAKKIRARLQKERLRRIERYKQRLALLLPPPSELGRHDTLL